MIFKTLHMTFSFPRNYTRLVFTLAGKVKGGKRVKRRKISKGNKKTSWNGQWIKKKKKTGKWGKD